MSVFDEKVYLSLINREDKEWYWMVEPQTIQFLSRLSATEKWTTRDYTLIKVLLEAGQKAALDYRFLATQKQPSARYIGIITNIKYSTNVRVNHGPGADPSKTFVVPNTAQIRFELDKAEKDKKVKDIISTDTQTDIKQLD